MGLRGSKPLGQTKPSRITIEGTQFLNIHTTTTQRLHPLKGLTSNPAIFEKAISGSHDYDDVLDKLRSQHQAPQKTYETLAIRDIKDAADVFWPVYDDSNCRDGYVSLEVSPHLARDKEGTLSEARRLWTAVARENLMIKVPATPECIPAIEQLISEGINVNVTLIFSREVHLAVMEAYVAGLDKRQAAGGNLKNVASVASFFVSRIDTAVDNLLGQKLKGTNAEIERKRIRSIQGNVAIANAKLAYQNYLEKFTGERWERLAEAGAQTQRVLWASTGTKNPALSDVIYVEELIGQDTVTTIPPSTLDAFRDHGQVRASLNEDVEDARAVLETLGDLGLSLDNVTKDLLDKGLLLFSEAFDKLLSAVDRGCACEPDPGKLVGSIRLPDDLQAEVNKTLDEWQAEHKVRRLWAGDESLWTRSGESKWLGWLGITEDQLANIDHLVQLSREVQQTGFTQIALLGMGGSSLCPDVLKHAFGKCEGFPELFVLDSADPAQIASFEARLTLPTTLFFVSSKSGSTLEPNIFKQYFYDKMCQIVGQDQAGSHFIAITDPGSSLQKIAEHDGFRHVLFGLPSIGGRYSALSDFGMAPAAAMGINIAKFLDRAGEMAVACSSCVPVDRNPGVVLGAVLGVAARAGRDKVTLVTSRGIRETGAWLEQLLAESTGKIGRGLIPVDSEPLGDPGVYGNDRVFVYLRLDLSPDEKQDQQIDILANAGHPVVTIAVPDIYHLGREFFRWEFATAVAGSIIGVNVFDQPDVEASKIATRELTAVYEANGTLPAEQPFFEVNGIKLFADDRTIDELQATVGPNAALDHYLKAHLDQLRPQDYFALLAYVSMNEEHHDLLQVARLAVRNSHQVATCLGFGPRFLHSTGQAYKGGPNSGVFLQVTCDDAADLTVPGRSYTFGIVKAAQARGDYRVLSERQRRALRIHLPADVTQGLSKLSQTIKTVCKQ